MTLNRIPEEQVQLQDFGTGLSGQTSALLVSVSLSTFAVCYWGAAAWIEPFLSPRGGETLPTAHCAPCRISLTNVNDLGQDFLVCEHIAAFYWEKTSIKIPQP